MPYLAIEDFKGGLDTRRMELTSNVGSLQTLKNAHITRGGEIEKALAFVQKYTGLSGTFGMAIVRGRIYVFGSAAAPGGLSGDLTYQRLQSPDGAAMTGIVAIDAFAGRLYVVADFAGGGRYHFYDGLLVGDWFYGLVRSSMTNNDGIAEALRALIDADPNYSATRVGSTITITGATDQPFTITANATNGEGNSFNDQTAIVSTTQTAVTGQVEVLSVGSFRVTAGTNNPGTDQVTVVTVDGVDVLGAAVDWATSNSATAAAVAAQINTYTSGTEYTATSSGDKVTLTALAGTGATPNNKVISVTKTGTVAISDITNMAGGISAVLGSTVTGTLGVAQTAFTPINSSFYNIGLRFTATASGYLKQAGLPVSTFTAAGVYAARLYTDTGSGPGTPIGALSNTVNITAIGQQDFVFAAADSLISPGQKYWVVFERQSGTPNFTVSVGANQTDYGTGKHNTSTSITDNLGSELRAELVQYGPLGQSQISTVVIGGTFEPGDLFSIVLNSVTFGASRVSGLDEVAALKIHKNKVYAGYKASLLFSGVAEPTKWKSEDVGSGVIDMSSQASGFEDITALAVYQNNLAIFSRNVTQIWYVDPDPDANSQLQVLENIGTRSPGSCVGFGDSDVFFLSDTGVRSLRARDASNSAAVSDVGTPIDTLVVGAMSALSDSDIETARAIIEPKDGRFILSLGLIMYVFSFFSSSRISSWSTYERGLKFDWFAKLGTKVFGRSGDSIYLLGGDNGATYNTDPVVIELPYVDGGKLANWKEWTGIDMAIEGTWLVEYNNDPNQPTIFETVATVNKHTIAEFNAAVQAWGPVFKLRLTNTAAGAARLGKILIHYRESKVT